MEYRITVTEIHKAHIMVEADSYEEAKQKLENEYWENPNAFTLEPEDTFFE